MTRHVSGKTTYDAKVTDIINSEHDEDKYTACVVVAVLTIHLCKHMPHVCRTAEEIVDQLLHLRPDLVGLAGAWPAQRLASWRISFVPENVRGYILCKVSGSEPADSCCVQLTGNLKVVGH